MQKIEKIGMLFLLWMKFGDRIHLILDDIKLYFAQ